MPQKKIKLGTQLHIRNGELDLKNIKEVQNQESLAKPKYGFWTSTYTNSKEGSHFNKVYPMTGQWYILEPSEANVFVVEAVDDVHFLLNNYGRMNNLDEITFIDFEKLSKDFDAIQLTKKCLDKGSPVEELQLYDEILKLNSSSSHPFYQWMGESTLWFNLKFCSFYKKASN